MFGNVWFFMIFIGILYGALTNNLAEVNNILFSEAQEGISFAIGLIGIISFWTGIMNVAEKSGLVRRLSGAFRPLIRILFPDIPRNHPAERWILMNFIANMFGMGNGATAFGLKAMKELDRLNPKKDIASNSMAMFLIINMSALQLIPMTIIKLRYDYGSQVPTAIIGPALLSTLASTIIAIIIGKIFEGGRRC